MCSSHICRVSRHRQLFRVESKSSHDLVQSESNHKNCRVTSNHWLASSSQCWVKWKPFNARYDSRHFCGHKSLAARARKLFKLSTDFESLLVSVEKIIFQFWVWGSLRGTSKVGLFSNFWPTLSSPGRQPNEPFFGWCFCWKLGWNPRLLSPWLVV